MTTEPQPSKSGSRSDLDLRIVAVAGIRPQDRREAIRELAYQAGDIGGSMTALVLAVLELSAQIEAKGNPYV